MKLNFSIYKMLWKDRIDAIMLAILFILAILDLGWKIVPSGGYAFFFVYVSWLVVRKNWWKYQVNDNPTD